MYTEIGTVLAACKGLVERTDEILSAFNACSKPRSQYKISARGWKRDAREIAVKLEHMRFARECARTINPTGSKEDIWLAVCLLADLAESYGCAEVDGYRAVCERVCTAVTAVVQPWYRDTLIAVTQQAIDTAEVVLARTDAVRNSIKNISSNVTLTPKYHEARVSYHVQRRDLELALEHLQKLLRDFTNNDATEEVRSLYLFGIAHRNDDVIPPMRCEHKNIRVRALREAFESCAHEIERVKAS